MMEDQWRNDPSKWIWGVFYFNKDDKRLLPPKRNPMMGWTINFGNPNSMLIFILLLLILIVLGSIS